MTPLQLAQEWHAQRSQSGALLAVGQVTTAMVEATRFYSGFAQIVSQPGQDLSEIDQDTDLTASEWSLIKPLAYLYIERESAIVNEASRGQGLEPIGRLSSEIEPDIARAEEQMQLYAFQRNAESIGVTADNNQLYFPNYAPYHPGWPLF